jgi:hypothetical protein
MITLNKTMLKAILLFFCTFQLNAQSVKKSHSKHYLKTHPVWIEMMNDPNANYNETLRAFRLFWKDKVLPREPFENEETDTFEKEVGLEKDGESEREREREKKERLKKGSDKYSVLYASDVRAFKGWMQGVKPWVRADGSIVTPEERQKIIDKQAQELKEIEQKNGKK